MENETENSLTIGEVCGIVWKRILYVLAASVLVTVVALLVFIFAINPSKVSYSGEFWVVYPASETQKYPDGSPFFYHDIISKASLQEVVDSDEQLKHIDVEKLLKDEGISFTAQRNEEEKIYTGQYSISVKGKSVSGYEEAKRLVTAISQKFVSSINESAENVDYTVSPEIFQSLPYDMQLKSLADQKTKLLSEIDKWITLYHESYKVNGKSLKNYRAEIEAVYGDNVRKTLEAEWERCGYVPEDEITTREQQLSAEKEYNLKQIKKLQEVMTELGLNEPQTQSSSASGIELYAAGDDNTDNSDDSSKWVINIQSASDLLQTLAKFLTRNEQIDYQLKHLRDVNKSENPEVKPFAELVQDQYDKLSEKAETLADVTEQIYKENSRVLASEQVLTKSGETNVILVAVAAFVLAFLIAAVVVFCIDAPKYKAKKLSNLAEAEAPAEEPEAEENKPQE